MTTDLEPPAPLPINSRAGWFKAPVAVVHGVMTMAEAEPEAAQPKVKVLRRTAVPL